MKNLNYLILLALAGSLTLSSCFVDIHDDNGLFGCIDADGPITVGELELDEITSIKLAMDAKVELTQGDEQIVSVEGKSDILDEIDLDVDNGEWTIRTIDCVRDVDDLTFYITLPDLRSVAVSGSGDVYSTNTFLLNDIDLKISGSGEIDMALEGDDVECEISGSGKMYLEGTADELDMDITGSGDLRAFGLTAREGDIRISGSGDAEVNIIEYLRVRISGSGDVYFRGEPTLDISVSGSGDVIDAN